MKILFLDFDGVLNTGKYSRQLHREKRPGWDDFGELFDPDAVANLKLIIDTVPDVKLVVESSWKASGMNYLAGMWAVRDLPGKLFGMTPDLPHKDLLQFDLADPDFMVRVEGHCKGNEILAWMKSHADEECRYVIIDDCSGFTGELKEHLVLVDPYEGLTQEDTMKAIMLLCQKDYKKE